MPSYRVRANVGLLRPGTSAPDLLPDAVALARTMVTVEASDVEVVGDPQARESQQYQSAFIGGIADQVVGKDIDEVSVSRVAGSSLTSGGFMKALAEIKAEAAA